MHTPTHVEICIATVEDAIVAEKGGADRVELNCALELGGLTPSLGAMRETREAVSLPVIAMIRPRAGGFCYSDHDLRVMSRDIELMLESGADGIAFGILSQGGRVDAARCRQLIQLIERTRSKQWQGAVLHRAFDFTPDPFEALEMLIDLGFRRVMTSGQCPTALEGADLIRELIERARGRIEVLPAGGIRPHNVQSLLRATACDQVHASLRAPVEGVGSGTLGLSLGTIPDQPIQATSPNLLREFVQAAGCKPAP